MASTVVPFFEYWYSLNSCEYLLSAPDGKPLLAAAGVDERVVKKIVGHKGQGVTQIVYTHFEIAELLDAINRI